MAVGAVTIRGTSEVKSLLNSLPQEHRRAQVNGINRTMTEHRRENMVLLLISATGIKRKVLNADIRISRARLRRPTGAIRPSRFGIPVPEYTHRAVLVEGSTRAQIWVRFPNATGWKLAAGFINPRGRQQAPLRTYNWRGPTAGALDPPETAIGLSAAALAAEINTPQSLNKAADLLQINTDRELIRQYQRRA